MLVGTSVKKGFVFLLVMVLVLGTLLSACSKGANNGAVSNNNDSAGDVAANNEDSGNGSEEKANVEDPIAKEDEVTVTINPYKAVDQPVPYEEIMKSEAEWLSWLQFESGAVPKMSGPNGEKQYSLTPYFTVIGLEGLLEVPGYESVVLDYMNWHFAHLNRIATDTTPLGSIYDYTIAGDKVTETPTGDFDSTDSYGSTFLNLLRKYAEVTGDTAYLVDHKDDILLIAGAMLATLEPDGLTWAKPSYKVKYLMDNAEVYAGLRDMEWISAEVFGDSAGAAEFKRVKDIVFNAIEKEFWNESRQAYAYAKGANGALSFPNWDVFYADSTAQLFPILTGVIESDSERAINLYNKFNVHQRGWPVLDKPDAFPWAIIAYTAALMGDKNRVDHFLTSVKSEFIDKGHHWPWYVMESGLTIWTASLAKELAN